MATTTKKTTKKENTEETKVKKVKKTATASGGSKTTAKKTKGSVSSSTTVSKTEKKAPKSSKTKGHCNTSGFNLVIGNISAFLSDQAILSEGDVTSGLAASFIADSVRSSVLSSLRH